MLSKMRILRITILICLVATMGWDIPVQADDGKSFQLYGDSPVVSHGEAGTWNATYTDPGAVVVHDGMFHMFYNGFNGWPASVQVGYATSQDGLIWTKQGENPVFETRQVQFAGVAALASSAIVRDDGTWLLYFYTWEGYSGRLEVAKGQLGVATAPSPKGPWIVEPQPILSPGPAGAWDELRLDSPSVIKTEQGYVMYYTGASKTQAMNIGMAMSEDGIHWAKYNDPTTINGRYADSDPIFQQGDKGTWDAPLVHQPRVIHTTDGWVMLYRSLTLGRPSTIALGLALSEDGIHWQRHTNNPIFKVSKTFGKYGIWFTGLAYKEGIYFMFLESSPPTKSDHTAVFVATYQGSLKE